MSNDYICIYIFTSDTGKLWGVYTDVSAIMDHSTKNCFVCESYSGRRICRMIRNICDHMT